VFRAGAWWVMTRKRENRGEEKKKRKTRNDN
jgi:hypothetical protein